MAEHITITRGNASIAYDLLDDEKAAMSYKKIRNLTEQLNTCKDYAEFHDFVKKLKPSDSYNIMEVSLWTDDGFFVRIGHMLSLEENDESELDEIEAAG